MQYKFEKPVQGVIGTIKYQCGIAWRNGQFISDEPASEGGGDTGPDPHTLLLASLASCTLVTLRMYIDRKGWNIPSIKVNTNLYQVHRGDDLNTIIDRDIIFDTPIPEDQKTRLQEIASHCPISKILENDLQVRTYVFHDTPTEKVIHYSNDEVTVDWKPDFCQHSTRCFTQLPGVFNPKEKKWINPSGAGADVLEEQVNKCPSGALRFRRNKK